MTGAEKSGKMKRDHAGGQELGAPPSPFFYGLIHHGTALLCRLLVHPRITRDPRLTTMKGPLIVLSNHPSYLDPPLVAMVLPKRRIHFLTTQVFFRNPLIGWILFKVGAIPKIQFRSDSRALKAMLKVLGRGGALSIFPEGQRSIDGTPTPFDDAIAKMVRKTKCAVAVVRIEGGYLTWPRWTTSRFRRGRIDVRGDLLLSGDESATLSVDEIQSRLVAALSYQEYDWQRRERVRFRSSRPAESLHRILHHCPACRQELVMRSKRNRLYCKNCGNTAVMDGYGFLRPSEPTHQVFEDVRQWHLWQIDQQRETVTQPGFRASYAVELTMARGEEAYVPAGNGELILSANGFDYQGTDGERPISRHFPLPGRGGLNVDYGISIELADADASYRVKLDDGQKVIQIVDRVQALLDKKPADQR